MKHYELKIIYEDGEQELVTVYARGLNSAFRKALDLAGEPLGSGRRRVLHAVIFSAVID